MTTAFGPRTRTRVAAACATTALAAALTFTAAGPAFAIAPTATADFYAVTAGTPLTVSAAAGILANDTDPENDPVGIHSLWSNGAALPGEELVTNSDGSFTYYPPTGYTGTREWLYRAQDATDVSPVVAITFTITAPPPPAGNVAPIGTTDAFAVAQDAVFSIAAPGLLANDSDADGDSLTVVAQGYDTPSMPGESLTTQPDGSLVYFPPTGYTGTRTWWYQVGDGTHSVKTSIVFTIAPAPAGNTAPVANTDTYPIFAGAFDTSAPGVLGNDADADGDPITVSAVQPNGSGVLPGESLVIDPNGAIHYVPPTGYLGARTWRYRVSDGFAQSGWAEVTFEISAFPNVAPVAIPDAYDVLTNTKLVAGAPGLLANDWDADGDALVTGWTGEPVGGVLFGESFTVAADGSFEYQPPIGFTGTRVWTYDVHDGVGGSSPFVSVTFTIATPPNTAPVVVADAYEVVQDTDLVVSAPGVLVNDTDADGDALGTSWTGEPVGGVLPGEKWTLAGDGSFVYTPPTGYVGTRTWMYSAHDSLTTSGFAPVTFTIAAVPPLQTLPGSPASPTTSGAADGGGEGGSLAATGLEGAGVAGTAALAGILLASGMVARRFSRREA